MLNSSLMAVLWHTVHNLDLTRFDYEVLSTHRSSPHYAGFLFLSQIDIYLLSIARKKNNWLLMVFSPKIGHRSMSITDYPSQKNWSTQEIEHRIIDWWMCDTAGNGATVTVTSILSSFHVPEYMPIGWKLKLRPNTNINVRTPTVPFFPRVQM